MSEQLEAIESLANYFDSVSPGNSFIKEKITNVYFPNKFKINFKNNHVAISKNGGLIALCRKKNLSGNPSFSFASNSNNEVLVMQQNAKHIYKIPITWNVKNRWIVAFDFSENENLYGICNDGTIYKFDILLEEAKEQLTSEKLLQEKIYKAKFVDKGFVALTNLGVFYYVKDFKNIYPKSMFQVKSILEFSNNVDFVAIPPSSSKSGKLELLFTNEKGDGVIHVMEQPDKYDYNILPIEINNETKLTIDHVLELKENELKPYIKIETVDNDKKKSNNEISSKENEIINTNSDMSSKSMGKIISMAISPSYQQVAFYNNKGTAYIFNSKFDKGRKEIKFDISNDVPEEEKIELEKIIKFNENCQFLFCGEDAVVLCGNKFVLIGSNFSKKTLVYRIVDEDIKFFIEEEIYAKCISEVDGLRVSTNNGIYFISKVDKNLYKSCDPFENNIAKKLLKAYISDLLNEPDSSKKIKSLGKELSDSIFMLLNAATNIFWIDDESDNKNKDVQLYLLKAAQLGKIFIEEKDDFNYDKFVEICKDLRIVNNLRNNKESPIFITYKQYKSLDFQVLIKKILLQHNFNLAYKISKYLEYDTKKIYQKWACCKIKKLKKLSSKAEQMKLYEDIIYDLEKIKNVSYIQLAKKAFKCKHSELGMKFLDNEKSILAKIPIYLKHNQLDKVLELSYETYDADLMEIALSQLIDYTGVNKNFINKVKDKQNLHFAVFDFLKKYGDKTDIDKYLEDQCDYEELMFIELEKFFTSNTIDLKKKHLKLAKEYQKKLDKNNTNNKFYLMYLNELSNSIRFKNECMNIERKIIPKSYIMPFDNSIYDCYKFGVKVNKFDWIKEQNKNYELSNKKLTLMRFKTMAENNKIDLIEDIIKSSSLKKLGVTPLNMAEFYFDYKKYDLAAKYIKLVTQQEYFDYKIEMLKYMEKYEDVLEVAFSCKNMEKIPDIVNDILNKKPELQKNVKDLCTKYKVNLS